ncbi:PASTA domain-containing protein [Nonomuraea ceibae]|uniref:PASTA domain-containing protein n=1 Tax=Nonomuraea ceibae TaxID=1935170 RepID=UPI001C5E030C|nr:PASTA domain-containing protein [Nonomuraea ceibae]
MHLARALTPTALLIAATAAACSPAAPSTTTSATTPAPAVTVTATTTTTPPPSGDLTTDQPESTAPSRRSAQRVRLPDVVGMNLQAAQDHLQATGFYILNDKDATGQGRLQVLDRNWVVVRQTPAAGKRVPTSTLITLYAKKLGE